MLSAVFAHAGAGKPKDVKGATKNREFKPLMFKSADARLDSKVKGFKSRKDQFVMNRRARAAPA